MTNEINQMLTCISTKNINVTLATVNKMDHRWITGLDPKVGSEGLKGNQAIWIFSGVFCVFFSRMVQQKIAGSIMSRPSEALCQSWDQWTKPVAAKQKGSKTVLELQCQWTLTHFTSDRNSLLN